MSHYPPFRLLFLAMCILGLLACASMTTKHTPKLMPNAKFQRTPQGQVQSDIDDCLALADQYVEEPNRYTSIAKQGLVGGAVGAGTGAVAGAITGNAGRGTGAGAAVGGILGVLRGLNEMNERTPSYQRFVEHCLQRKGYEVTGWGS
jgi:hypothetical protein